MSLVLEDRVRETTGATGTGPVNLLGAITGYRAFSAVMVNGDTTWYCIVLPGSAWEVGIGTWVTGNALQRTTVIRSSNSGGLVNFPAGTKDVFITLPAIKSNVQNNTFPSGTLMLFQQTNAPVYWTKQVTHNDKALRVVSGATSSGGTNAFSTIFNNPIATQNTTITVSSMPSHNHSYLVGSAANVIQSNNSFPALTSSVGANTGSTGGDGAHSHALIMSVAYVDLIIASKD
ncbi:hypothetical protein QCM80_30190 [Bradyrhizobium sp. SSUT112]|uniref:hypothetical protein n=1 Tax=Bradyrhizobium sp. SSUT112 TaxID=3040604 RepID=UPI00244A3ACA|nr:hypothetical protein [Bradyrhizobium sp. SSUT112]MDH2354906.1 hypothetical protein [Bradyrhizobium sp. SSUT112]